MTDKWYNSNIATRFGSAAIVLALGFGGGALFRGCGMMGGPGANEIEIERIKHEYKMQTADLNGNNIPEKFYCIDGKIALVEMDNIPVLKEKH